MPFPVDESYLVAAGIELGRRLPNGFRDRLLRDNGGSLATDDEDWELHPVLDTSDRKRTSRTASHIIKQTEFARSWPRFPQRAVALANNGEGDLLIVQEGSEQTELWDHATGELAPIDIDWS